MNNEARKKLLGIKSHCELDKDLKISDLEKENAYLLIQVNKYKKQFAKLRPETPKKLKGVEKQDAIQGLHKKVRSIKAAHQEEKERIRKSVTKWKNKMQEHVDRENFITKHFIRLNGKQAFIEIMGRLDSPSGRIHKKEKFLASTRFDDER